jgi:hypothetical protein
MYLCVFHIWNFDIVRLLNSIPYVTIFSLYSIYLVTSLIGLYNVLPNEHLVNTYNLK